MRCIIFYTRRRHVVPCYRLRSLVIVLFSVKKYFSFTVNQFTVFLALTFFLTCEQPPCDVTPYLDVSRRKKDRVSVPVPVPSVIINPTPPSTASRSSALATGEGRTREPHKHKHNPTSPSRPPPASVSDRQHRPSVAVLYFTLTQRAEEEQDGAPPPTEFLSRPPPPAAQLIRSHGGEAYCLREREESSSRWRARQVRVRACVRRRG
jgi:hypothetical protein